MRLINKIREHREKKGITMKDLAEQLDVTYTHLSTLERNGQQTIKSLDVDQICEILDVHVNDLFYVIT